VWGIVPKAAWHWGGDSSVANDPFGAPGSTRSYVCVTIAWGSADCDCSSSSGTNMNHKQSTGKMAKALVGFRFSRLKIFMEPSDYDEIPLCKVLYLARGTGLQAKQSR
jgi:hypothetical protein